MAIKDSHGGHHGKGKLPNVMDPGAVGSGYLEADLAHRINELVIKYTKAADTSDYKATTINQNLANIVANMNLHQGDWHISNHLNAFNSKANGLEVWYWAGDAKSKEMAEQVAAALSKATGMANRGAKATTNFYVLRNSVGRTLLIEWGFIDYKTDVEKLLKTMDKAVQELVKLFGYSSNADTAAKPSTPPAKPAAPKNPFANIVVDSNWDTNLNKYLQQYYKLPIKDGIISGQIKGTWNAGITGIEFGAGGSNLVAAIQKDVGVPIDRNMGPGTIKAMQKKAGTEQDGAITRPSALAKKIKQNLKTKGKPW